ncbi:MAG: site-2 protease family protein, partial [Christensenellales bacterium]
VFNLLPIPALDGSKMIFTTIEWIRKKPINPKVENMIHNIGFLVLMGLVIIADLYHLLFL